MKKAADFSAHAFDYEDELEEFEEEMSESDDDDDGEDIPGPTHRVSRMGSGIFQAQRRNVYTKSFREDDFEDLERYPKLTEDIVFLLQVLNDNFLFSALPKKQLYNVVDLMQKEVKRKGAMIMEEGEEEFNWFYVLTKGKLQFIKDGMVCGKGSPGCTIGEMALMFHSARASSVTVVSETATLYKIHQKTFRYVLSKDSQLKTQTFKDLAHRIPLFKNLRSTQIAKLSDELKLEQYHEGDKILKKGDVGDKFYIIKTGYVFREGSGLGQTSQYVDKTLKPGDWFGCWVSQKYKNGEELHDRDDEETTTIGNAVAETTYTATTDVQVLVMDRKVLENSVGNFDKILHGLMKIQLLKGLPIFAGSDITDFEYEELTNCMVKRDYKSGHKINYKDEDRRRLWVVRSGYIQLDEITDTDEKTHMLKQGDYFGDNWIQYDRETLDKCKDTAKCVTDTKCYVIRRDELETIIKDLSRLGSALPRIDPNFCTENLSLDKLKKHKVLGQGQFGTVWLVTREPDTKNVYALKTLDKLQLLEHSGSEDMIINIIREKEIMNMMDHPFIAKLHATFQDEHKLYMLLPLIQGGELFGRIYLSGGDDGLPMEDTIFYAACIVEALHHMHRQNVVFRDLKPENVLIDKEGYGCLIDFGFAKVVPDKTYTLCGTPEYLAPEILICQGHNCAADYWSLGTIVFEMLAGASPFYWEGVTQPEMARAILAADYSFGSTSSSSRSNDNSNDLLASDRDPTTRSRSSPFNDPAKDFISKLLVVNPSERLGHLADGAKDVMAHPFLESIDFKELVKKEIIPPWKPKIKNAMDVSNFGDSNDIIEDPGAYRTISKKEQELFEKFSS